MDNKLLVETEAVFHQLTQFPAAFSNTYLVSEDDDSQANVGWDSNLNRICSRIVNESAVLVLDYNSFELSFITDKTTVSLPLAGESNQSIEDWMRLTLHEIDLDGALLDFDFNFSSELKVGDLSLYTQPDESAVKQLILSRNLVQHAAEAIQVEYPHTSEVRVWAHHFDTGMLVGLGEEGNLFDKGLGMGSAIADSISPIPYYYVYPYGTPTLDLSKFPALEFGEFIIGSWQGAILPATTAIDKAIVQAFFTEAISVFERRM